MRISQIRSRISELSDELRSLQNSRPAHSLKVEMEMRIEELEEEIASLQKRLREAGD